MDAMPLHLCCQQLLAQFLRRKMIKKVPVKMVRNDALLLNTLFVSFSCSCALYHTLPKIGSSLLQAGSLTSFNALLV